MIRVGGQRGIYTPPLLGSENLSMVLIEWMCVVQKLCLFYAWSMLGLTLL